MPYIPLESRHRAELAPDTPGELNFAITCLLLEYVNKKGLLYMVMNDCLGALEGAKLEFARRVLYPYEDAAKERNGDVYV